jgi:hypothetical protein
MMMSYDQSGGHHSEYKWGNKMIDQGAAILPEQQVAAGLPFYGKKFACHRTHEYSFTHLLLRYRA